MKPQKVRFTVWLDPTTLEAAKVRSRQDGVSVSEALAEAASESLLRNRADAEAQIVKAVERVFHLVQRTDRRRGFDGQVLKEMVGLMVLSFFNHTPAVPEANKKAALLDGKVRFHRFLDTLAANLRTSKSILSDLPAELGEAIEEAPSKNEDPTAEAEDRAFVASESPGAAPHRRNPEFKVAEQGVGPERAPPGKARSPEQPQESSATNSPASPATAETPPAESESAPAKKRWGLFG